MDYQGLFTETLLKNMEKFPSKDLFEYPEVNKKVGITYKDFNQVISFVEEAFKGLGIKSHDRVAIISSTTESYIGLCQVLAYLGIVIVPIDFNLPLLEKNRLLVKSNAKAVFLEEEFKEGLEYDQISVFFMKRGCKYELIKPVDKLYTKDYEKSADDVMAILFSSGTTGTVKGVGLTYKAIWKSCEMMEKYAGILENDVFLNILPPSHVAGFGTAFSFLRCGTTLCFLEKLDPANLVKAFDFYKPSTFEAVPGIFELMKTKALMVIKRSAIKRTYYKFATDTLRLFRKKFGINLKFLTKPIYSKIFGPNIRTIGGGASPFSEELIKFYLDLGLNFVNVYGSTETCFPVCAYNVSNRYEYEGVGSVDQFGEIDIKINEPNEKGIGEIFVKSELMMKGYFKDPELTANAFTTDGFFKTGDLGIIGPDRRLYVKGRIKENIVLANGEKVTPSEVDEYYKMDGALIASVGVTTDVGCDDIHLFIQSEDESFLEKAYELSNAAPKNYKIKKAHLIKSLPVTSTGKIKRFELRKLV